MPETGHRTQRLLNRAVWDTSPAAGVVRRFAVTGLDEAFCRSGRRRGLVVGALGEDGPGESRARRVCSGFSMKTWRSAGGGAPVPP